MRHSIFQSFAMLALAGAFTLALQTVGSAQPYGTPYGGPYATPYSPYGVPYGSAYVNPYANAYDAYDSVGTGFYGFYRPGQSYAGPNREQMIRETD
jgi:hypothetical protein